MTEELKIKVGADVGQAVAGIKQVNTELSKTPAVMNKTGTAVTKTGKDFTNFGRVIQDLPFGIQGIQNNLTQLIPAAGGVGLAFTALVTALTFAQVGFGAWTRGLGDHKKTLSDLRDALEEYVDGLDSLRQARIRGAQGAQEELVKLKTLYDATQNQNIAVSKRKQLVDELQEQYPKYFANIKDETILAGGAKDAYDKLATAILATSRARAAQDTIVDIQKQVLVIEQQITDAIGKQAKAIIEANKAAKLYGQTQTKTAKALGEGSGVSGAAAILSDAEDSAAEAAGKVNKLYAQRNDLLRQALKLTGEVTSIVENNPDSLLDPTGGIGKSKEKIKKEVEKIRAEFTSFIGRDNPIPLFFEIKLAEFLSQSAPSETAAQKLVREKIKARGPIPVRVDVVPSVKFSKPVDEDIERALLDLETSLENAIANIGVQAFSTIGDAIAKGLTGGDVKDAFISLFQFIGGAIQDFGKQIIVMSKLMTALRAAISSFSGPLALAAGIGLVIAGGLMKNLKPKGFYSGGVVPGGYPNDGFLAKLTSGERVLTPEQNKRWEMGNFGSNVSFPEYLPVHRMTANQWDLFYKRSNRFVRNTH